MSILTTIKPVIGMCFSLSGRPCVYVGARDKSAVGGLLYCQEDGQIFKWADVKDDVTLIDCPSSTAGLLKNLRAASRDKFCFVAADYQVAPVTRVVWKCCVRGRHFVADSEGLAIIRALKAVNNGEFED